MFLASLAVTGISKIIPPIMVAKDGNVGNPIMTFVITKMATPIATVNP